MNIWYKNEKKNNDRWKTRCYYDSAIPVNVKKALEKYMRWIRRKYIIKNSMDIYFINEYRISALLDNERVFGTVLFSDDATEKTIVRIACGYSKCPTSTEEWDNHIAGIILTLTHELTHVLYEPEIAEHTQHFIEWHCTHDSDELLDDYAKTHKHLI